MSPPSLKDKPDGILKQFREQLQLQDLIHEGDTIGTDDAILLRFLRARQFDLKTATTMWANCQHWRKTVEGVGIDELYRNLDPYDYPEREKVFQCWPLWFHKTDKKGRPLNIHHFGGINMPELYKHITPERFWRTIVVNAESLTREVLPASARAANRQIDGTFVIVDLKGFGLSQFWQMKNLARDSFQISQDYFPETMAQLAIINAPSSFTTIWGFIKPWLAKETLSKIAILGTDYKDVLLEQIDAENLPESLGGTCTCAEVGGCRLSNAGPWMENRKERRERWLRGERKRIGLGMEGEDEVDGVRHSHGKAEETDGQTQPEAAQKAGDAQERPDAGDASTSQKAEKPETPEEEGARASEQIEEAGQWEEAQPTTVEAGQASEVPPQPHPQPIEAAMPPVAAAGADTYGKATEVVDAQGGAEKAGVSPESSAESTSGPPTPSTESESSFVDARSQFSTHSQTSQDSKAGRSAFHRLKAKLPKVASFGKKLSLPLSRDTSPEKTKEKSRESTRAPSRDKNPQEILPQSHEQHSVDEVYQNHPDTRQPEMGDFLEQ
ncbi:hypothetical protein POSPLADRAFT_1059109 [Postia placenta MAD-698-R-SB12]|uniref:CRAL-TRIO domain-containing protein n=1 Tax=Postia placenta MAD-698-R-SB12 TaxID=670580 RepID=A0A1X6MUB2_9APHY|nr:hypothetical protein POSPLADRAFT_1059109 [Postia placenta MAD-698-R-SB12]OSX59816.1 hypothetical protein POSPLADRAFT_1059109 [Postia placenta MAD-698-R-SB12]